MLHTTTLSTHIIAGSLGIIFGFIALFAAKGAALHKKAGMGFVYAMIVMAVLGSTIAVVWNKAPGANAPVGLLTAYLVITSLTTVRAPANGARWIDLGSALLASAVTLTLLNFAIVAMNSPKGMLYGMPSFPFFMFAAIGTLAVVGDLRLIRAGGVSTIRGVPRIRRHLWRMTTALLIAAFSFFLGQAKVIPKPYRIFPLLIIPPLIVLGALIYWLWRVRVKRPLRENAAFMSFAKQ